MSLLTQLSNRLELAGYVRTADGTFATPDHRRVVVLVEAHRDTSRWAEQVTTALSAPFVQTMAAWARYIVLIHLVTPDEALKQTAASFARDVTKCRRLVVFPLKEAAPTLPFLPLDTQKVDGLVALPGNVSDIISGHLGQELATLFEDPNSSHAAIEREIERRVNA